VKDLSKDSAVLQMNYLQSQANVQKLVEGVKLLRQLFQSNTFDQFRGQEIAPGSMIQSDAALEAYIRDTCSTVWLQSAPAKWALTHWRL